MTMTNERIIALIDMDCFFCQVEARGKPELKGKPMVVAQFDMVLAVNYEARELGVSRFIRKDEAKEKYPEVTVVSVPEREGKGDISKYRSAGSEVINVLKKHCPIVERASIDEAFLDLTDMVNERLKLTSTNDLEKSLLNTYVFGYCDTTNDDKKRASGMKKWLEESADCAQQERKLAVAAIIVDELRAEILEKCKFQCSAGISYNKILAKLACGLHKPNKQTILSEKCVPDLYNTLPVNKLRGLGGKIGKTIVDKLNCKVMADVLNYSVKDLEKYLGEKSGIWLYNLARGIDHEPVKARLIPMSVGASKNFWGDQAITNITLLKTWIDALARDVSERLEQDLTENQRRATTVTVSFQYSRDKKNISQSRASPLASYKAEKIGNDAFDVIRKSMQTPIVYLSISATNFVESKGNFVNYFQVKNKGLSDKTEENCTNGEEDSLNKDGGVKSSVDPLLLKLQEIFPDLDDIDSSVLELLPIELQHEAKTYLQSKTKKPVETSVKKINTKKPKSGKSIENFFIKKLTDTVDESLMKKCNECGRMIETVKYLEHSDYHVAQNLQKSLNHSPNNCTKVEKRNRQSSISPKTCHKKAKSIQSYFSKL